MLIVDLDLDFSWIFLDMLLFLLCSQAGIMAMDPLTDCSQNSGNQHSGCDLKKNYLGELSCLCIPCRQSNSFCRQTAAAASQFWSRQCKDWEKKGFCKDLFLPQPKTTVPVATGGTTAGNAVKAAVLPSVYAANASTPTFKAAASNATGSVPRESGSTISNKDSHLIIALPFLVIALALLIVCSFIFYYRWKRNNQKQGRATPENPGHILIENPRLQQTPLICTSYNEQSDFRNEEETSFIHLDRLYATRRLEPDTDSFASMRAYSTISVNAAVIAQAEVHSREHQGDSGSTDSVLFNPEQDAPVLGNSHDPSEDLNSRPILNQSGENHVDSVQQCCCVDQRLTREDPASPEIEKTLPVRATQTSDPHQIREPPTSAENLPLLRGAVSA